MLAQHCFVMCPLPQFSQTVRCGTSHQFAIDTCDGGFVQTHVFFPLCGESWQTRDLQSLPTQVGSFLSCGGCHKSPLGMGRRRETRA